MYYGDDRGSVHVIELSTLDLNLRPIKIEQEEGFILNFININQLENGSSCSVVKDVHKDWVTRIQYIASLRTIISTSTDEENSFALIPPECFKYKNAFNVTTTPVTKGIKCFSFSASNSSIITGGGDRVLRIWLRGNYSEPTGKMKGHLFIITDVIVHDVSQLCFSSDSSNMIKIWDLRSLACLQYS